MLMQDKIERGAKPYEPPAQLARFQLKGLDEIVVQLVVTRHDRSFAVKRFAGSLTFLRKKFIMPIVRAMIPSPARMKRFGIAAGVTLALMLAMWWVVWTIGAVQYRHFIDNWIETHRSLGYQVTYDNRETEGFPSTITLHFGNFVLTNPDGVKVHANDVLLSAFPWHWRNFEAKLKHGFELTIPFTNDKTLLISTDAIARNHTELRENGDWKFVNLELTDAKALWGEKPFFGASEFRIALDRPDSEPKDHTQPGLMITGSADRLSLPPGLDGPFGPQAAKIDVSLRVMGPVPDPRLKESVAAWNGSGGVVEFESFYLQWGPLVFAAKGALGLDDDDQPEGVFASQIGNHQEVLKTLLAANDIPKHDAGMLDSALNLFAKHSILGGKPSIDVPISVQLGGLFLGPVRVFEFPEIVWEPVQPAALPAK
jgi:Uncharacterized protein conserved in bacteria (DUF2125)